MSARSGAEHWHREWSNERGERIKADTRIATLERELAEAKAREERLRVQLEVLSDACRAVDRYEAERDPRWIAVLQQKGDTNADV